RSQTLLKRTLTRAVILVVVLICVAEVGKAQDLVLTQWEDQMRTFGNQYCTALIAITNGPIDPALGATYYDAVRVYYQIAKYTGESRWTDCARVARDVYRDRYVVPNRGGVPGYWNFTTGLRTDFERTGDPTSKQAVVLLSHNAAYAGDATPIEYTAGAARSREVAYAILSYIDAEALGQSPRARRQRLVDQAYGHISQWIDGKWKGTDQYVGPFMVA